MTSRSHDLAHALFRFLMVPYRRWFARRRFYAFNKLLFNFSLRGIGILNNEDGTFESTGEAHFLRRMASVWGEHPTILDVGANVGDYSNRIMQLMSGARLYAFEPHPKTFDRLRQEAERHGYAAFNVACGHQRGRLSLYDYRDHDGSIHASLYEDVIASLHRGQPVAHDVEVITLDDFVEEHGIGKVDLIKIDTEGHEMKVLEGIRKTIAAGKVAVVQFEFNAMNVVSRCFFRDYVEILSGYEWYRLLPDGLVPLGEYSPIFCELFAFQNVVAVRKGCGLGR